MNNEQCLLTSIIQEEKTANDFKMPQGSIPHFETINQAIDYCFTHSSPYQVSDVIHKHNLSMKLEATKSRLRAKLEKRSKDSFGIAKTQK